MISTAGCRDTTRLRTCRLAQFILLPAPNKIPGDIPYELKLSSPIVTRLMSIRSRRNLNLPSARATPYAYPVSLTSLFTI